MYIKYPISKPPTIAITLNNPGLLSIKSFKSMSYIRELSFKTSSVH